MQTLKRELNRKNLDLELAQVLPRGPQVWVELILCFLKCHNFQSLVKSLKLIYKVIEINLKIV